MKIDLDIYKINKGYVQNWSKTHPDYGLGKTISTLSCSTSVPCIVIAFWVGEAHDWPEEVIVIIKSLMEFYGYQDIVGKPDNSPI